MGGNVWELKCCRELSVSKCRECHADICYQPFYPEFVYFLEQPKAVMCIYVSNVYLFILLTCYIVGYPLVNNNTNIGC